MLEDSVVHVLRLAFLLALKLSAPVLLSGIVVGLAVSIVQAVTSIQDQTLAFVPKIVAMVVAAAVLVPWMLLEWMRFASEMFLLR